MAEEQDWWERNKVAFTVPADLAHMVVTVPEPVFSGEAYARDLRIDRRAKVMYDAARPVCWPVWERAEDRWRKHYIRAATISLIPIAEREEMAMCGRAFIRPSAKHAPGKYQIVFGRGTQYVHSLADAFTYLFQNLEWTTKEFVEKGVSLAPIGHNVTANQTQQRDLKKVPVRLPVFDPYEGESHHSYRQRVMASGWEAGVFNACSVGVHDVCDGSDDYDECRCFCHHCKCKIPHYGQVPRG